jgi:hypothetical protein
VFSQGVNEMNTEKPSLDENIAIHIFTVSAAMIGVCLTVIGLVQIVIHPRRESSLADDFLFMDAILFSISCLLSYWALRKRNIKRMHKIEEIADIIFIIAIILMVVICGVIAYTLGMNNVS